MKEKLKILLPLGAIIGLFSAIIPFSDIFNGDIEYIEDIIYFRGILIGFLFCCIGGAAVSQGFSKAIVISIGCGVVSLITTSSLNLVNSDFIKTENYFWFTIYTIVFSFIVMLLINLFGVYLYKVYTVIVKKIRLCLNKVLHGFLFLKHLVL